MRAAWDKQHPGQSTACVSIIRTKRNGVRVMTFWWCSGCSLVCFAGCVEETAKCLVSHVSNCCFHFHRRDRTATASL